MYFTTPGNWASIKNGPMNTMDLEICGKIVPADDKTALFQKMIVVQNLTLFPKTIPFNSAPIDTYQLYQLRTYLSKIT